MVERIPKEDLLNEIWRLAEDIGETPTARQMDEHGEYSVNPYYTSFESWNDALQAAELEVNHRYDISREDALNGIRNLAEDIGRTPVRKDMLLHGEYAPIVYTNKFDSWSEALREAGYEPRHHRDVSRDEYLDEIHRLASNTGSEHGPTRVEMGERGKYAVSAYYNEFGSWSAALEAAGFELRYLRPGNRREYDYGSGWNQSKRQHIRQIDDHTCQHQGCDIDDDEHWEKHGEQLHVHHLVRANLFDEPEQRNDVRNLVTLCRHHHRTWEAADDYCPLNQQLPDRCAPEAVDPYMQ